MDIPQSFYNDGRLDKIDNALMSQMMTKKTSCIKALANSRSQEVKFGRFLRNTKVSSEKMIQKEVESTGAQVANRHVLAIMDTTELNYQHHCEKASELGTVGNGIDKGIFLHPTLVIDALNGGGLGFSAIRLWNRRKKKAKDYQSLPIEEKESYRWIEAAQETKKNLSSASFVTLIADRESDIYELWERIPDNRTALIVRASRDRRLTSEHKLYELADSLPIKDTRIIKIRTKLTRKSRDAQLQISYKKITLPKPKVCSDKKASPCVQATLVYVKERRCPKGEKPISWRLLTTHDIQTIENAWQIVDWYRKSWQIEQLFRTLKSQGIDIESSQLETVQGIENLTVMALKAALRIMQLVLAREGGTGQRTRDMFTPTEIELLDKLRKKYEGKTEKQKNPHAKKDLAWASWVIARLGGWKGYASESPPGPITMKKGLEYFGVAYSGWMLAKDVCIS